MHCIPKDFRMLHWIPIVCNRLSSGCQDDFCRDFIPEAVRVLNKTFSDINRAMKQNYSNYLTVEERKTVAMLEEIKLKELLCYHLSLKSVSLYLKKQMKKDLRNALKKYEDGVKTYQKLIEAMTSFTSVHLISRGKLKMA